MLIPSDVADMAYAAPSLSRRVNANSQPFREVAPAPRKLIKKGEC